MPPLALSSSPKWRFSSSENCNVSRWDRHTSPLTSTPAVAALHKRAPTSVPSPSRLWSGSPRQSVNMRRSPRRICWTDALRAAK